MRRNSRSGAVPLDRAGSPDPASAARPDRGPAAGEGARLTSVAPTGTRAQRLSRSGFTLLEVMVATALMAIAIVGLLANLTTSMSNAAKLTEYDRAALLARRKMDEVLTERYLPRGAVLQGLFTPAQSGGVESGWQARITPAEWRGDGFAAGDKILERVELEVWWKAGEKRKTLQLETYRATMLRDQDAGAVPSAGRSTP